MKKYSGQADDKKEYSESRVSDSDNKKMYFFQKQLYFSFLKVQVLIPIFTFCSFCIYIVFFTIVSGKGRL